MCCRSFKKTDPVVAIGFEVDTVKKAESGDCMVRLTVYHRSSGNVCFYSVFDVVINFLKINSRLIIIRRCAIKTY